MVRVEVPTEASPRAQGSYQGSITAGPRQGCCQKGSLPVQRPHDRKKSGCVQMGQKFEMGEEKGRA